MVRKFRERSVNIFSDNGIMVIFPYFSISFLDINIKTVIKVIPKFQNDDLEILKSYICKKIMIAISGKKGNFDNPHIEIIVTFL